MSQASSELLVPEAARYLNTTEASIRHAIARQKLPAVKRFSRICISRESLDDYARRHAMK